jgi:hypothetical protein
MELTNVNGRARALKHPVSAEDLNEFTWPPPSSRGADLDGVRGPADHAPAAVTAEAAGAEPDVDIAPRGRGPISSAVRSTLMRREVIVAALAAVVLLQGAYIVSHLVRRAQPAAGVVASQQLVSSTPARPVTAEAAPARPARANSAAVSPVGELQVTSNPSGAAVTVDGKAHGATPARVTDLAAGVHRVVLTRDGVSVSETVNIAENARVSLVVPFNQAPQTGWISVALPIDVQVFENDHLVGVSKSDRIMVPAGMHRFDLVNEALGYRATQQVKVSPGAVARLTAVLPKGLLSVNAEPWAEVSVDGERVGETPLANVSLTVGSHRVVFRHPELGTQTRTIVVSAASPARLSVDMKR